MNESETSAVVIGIFVGGKGSRMGGCNKGLLPSPHNNEPILNYLLAIIRNLTSVQHETVLVGNTGVYSTHWPELTVLNDAQQDCGPLGGLVSLLSYARGRRVVAIACDMPHITTRDIEILATQPMTKGILSPQASQTSPWEPLFASYQPSIVLPVAKEKLEKRQLSLQKLLLEIGVETAHIDARSLRDWDTKEDIERDLHKLAKDLEK